MSTVMRGLGLAHVLAEAFDNSQASFGQDRMWTDQCINALTTKEGKRKVLGPVLDVLRGDAEIVPKKRVIDTTSIKPGDKDGDGVVVFNRLRVRNARIPRYLVLDELKVGVASYSQSRRYDRILEHKPETIVDVPEDLDLCKLNRRFLLPNYLLGRKLPGVALRDFYAENPHHIPGHLPDLVLFWGTICKNDRCYYVPGLYRDGSKYGMRIATYKTVDGKDVLEHSDDTRFELRAAAVLI